jgi:hypothetical protein
MNVVLPKHLNSELISDMFVCFCCIRGMKLCNFTEYTRDETAHNNRQIRGIELCTFAKYAE